MITDQLRRVKLYENLGEPFRLAFAFLSRDDLYDLQPGRYEIDGDSVYASVSEYETKPADQGKPETHRKTIAVQCVLEGEELIGYAPADNLTISAPYDAAKDKQFYTGDMSMVRLSKGDFMVVFPQDGHMAKISPGDKPVKVKKCNVKIRIR